MNSNYRITIYLLEIFRLNKWYFSGIETHKTKCYVFNKLHLNLASWTFPSFKVTWGVIP